jgi:Flp pilus assembly protein TadB
MKHLLFLIGFLLLLGAPAQASEMATSRTHAALAGSAATAPAHEAAAKRASLQERIAQTLLRKAVKKAEKRQARRGVKADLPDFAALAGAIVVIVGIISIISNPIYGIIVALFGLLVYLLATSAGGSIGNVFR